MIVRFLQCHKNIRGCDGTLRQIGPEEYLWSNARDYSGKSGIIPLILF